MKVNVVKQLAETHSIQALKENLLLIENGEPLSIEVGGDDEGEQMTHLLGAIWILEQMMVNSTDLKTELRKFTARVRNSIS